MGRGEKVQDAKAALFKRLHGVKPDTFAKMLSILQKEFDDMHKSGGKPPKLKPEDKLYVTLKYLREHQQWTALQRNTVYAKAQSVWLSNGCLPPYALT